MCGFSGRQWWSAVARTRPARAVALYQVPVAAPCLARGAERCLARGAERYLVLEVALCLVHAVERYLAREVVPCPAREAERYLAPEVVPCPVHAVAPCLAREAERYLVREAVPYPVHAVAPSLAREAEPFRVRVAVAILGAAQRSHAATADSSAIWVQRCGKTGPLVLWARGRRCQLNEGRSQLNV
ncbi:MAG TPA: hypothetical protein VM325_10845 [Alphaproteobacteria bacterium]|nr:hypothetical protein [Alphaproteobacteria bacterium]